MFLLQSSPSRFMMIPSSSHSHHTPWRRPPFGNQSDALRSLPLSPLTLATSLTSSSAPLLHHIPPARGLLAEPQTRQGRYFIRAPEFSVPSAWTAISPKAASNTAFPPHLQIFTQPAPSQEGFSEDPNPKLQPQPTFHSPRPCFVISRTWLFCLLCLFPLKCNIHKGRDFCLSCVLYSPCLEQHCPT